MAERRKQGPRERAVRRDLRGLANLAGVESYAALALELAKMMDLADGRWEPKDEARLAAELRRTMVEVARAATKMPAADGVDELRKRRERRRGA